MEGKRGVYFAVDDPTHIFKSEGSVGGKTSFAGILRWKKKSTIHSISPRLGAGMIADLNLFPLNRGRKGKEDGRGIPPATYIVSNERRGGRKSKFLPLPQS